MAKNINQDPVNNPRHYTDHPSGVECITVTEHMSFNLGNAVKYIWRCDLKRTPLKILKRRLGTLIVKLQKGIKKMHTKNKQKMWRRLANKITTIIPKTHDVFTAEGVKSSVTEDVTVVLRGRDIKNMYSHGANMKGAPSSFLMSLMAGCGLLIKKENNDTIDTVQLETETNGAN